MNSPDLLWVIIATALIVFMQAGFLCLEVGFVQPKNAASVALKNLIDWAVVSVVFYVIGFALMFGSSYGLAGGDKFFLNGLTEHGRGSDLGYAFFLFQLAFAGTAATIVSGAMAERTSFVTYLWTSVGVGAVIYPVFGHWAWSAVYDASNPGFLAKLGFMDFAGSTVVHSVGAWVALVGVWRLGPRLGRVRHDGSLRDMQQNGIAWSALGTFLLWVGWIGFNGGSHLAVDKHLGAIIANTYLAGAASGLAALVHAWFFQSKRHLNEKFIGGILGGLVAITASCNVVTPATALLLGVTAGVVHNWAYVLITDHLRLDDPVGAIAVHGACGAWGTLCVALLGQEHLLAHSRLTQLGVQALGILVCFVWTTTTAFLLFSLLRRTVGLRVSPDEERAGIRIGGGIEAADLPQEDLDEESIRKLMGG